MEVNVRYIEAMISRGEVSADQVSFRYAVNPRIHITLRSGGARPLDPNSEVFSRHTMKTLDSIDLSVYPSRQPQSGSGKTDLQFCGTHMGIIKLLSSSCCKPSLMSSHNDGSRVLSPCCRLKLTKHGGVDILFWMQVDYGSL